MDMSLADTPGVKELNGSINAVCLGRTEKGVGEGREKGEESYK